MQLSNQIIALIQDILQPTPTPQEGEASGGQVEKTDRPGNLQDDCHDVSDLSTSVSVG